jgi:hypothetical protein
VPPALPEGVRKPRASSGIASAFRQSRAGGREEIRNAAARAGGTGRPETLDQEGDGRQPV